MGTWKRGGEDGDPETIRTSDLQIRNLPLYPAELRGHCFAQSTIWRPLAQRHFRTTPMGAARRGSSQTAVLPIGLLLVGQFRVSST